MGWNTSFVLAEGMKLADMKRLIPDVFSITKRTVGWEEASSSGMGNDLALGALPEWGAIWTLNLNVTLFPEVLEAASRKGRAVAVVLSSVSDTYGFEVWLHGKESRRLMRSVGEVVAQAGKPWPEEADLDWEDGENALFTLARRLTGVDVGRFDTWESVRFVVAELG